MSTQVDRPRLSEPYVTRNRFSKGGRSYCYVVLRYDEYLEDGSRQPRKLLSLGAEEKVDLGRARSLADTMREYVRKGSTMTLGDLKQRLTAAEAEPALRILCSRQFGLRFLVEQAFDELGYKEALAEIDEKARRRFAIERTVFGMVLQQVVWPGSKLRAAERLGEIVFYPEGEGLGVHHYYRTLDVLAGEHDRIEQKLREKLDEAGLVFDALSHDTTSSYFETDYDDGEWKQIAEDRAVNEPDRVLPVVNEPPLRMRGHSKDKRPNKPQIVVEQVVGEGYVLHHQTHPGNTADSTLLVQTSARLAELGVAKDVVWVGDAGMNTKKSRAALAEHEIEWVMGEGRARTKVVREILASGGRYKPSPENPDLSYKSFVRDGRLYVLRLNRVERDRELRTLNRHLKRVREILAVNDRADSSKKVCALLSHRTYKRYVKPRVDDPNRLVLDKKAISRTRNQAGKSVISTSLDGLEAVVADDLYRLQFGVEDAFRTHKTGLDLRPIRHRLAHRIKAHVLVQVMALNVTRHIERKTGLRLERLRDTIASVTVQRVELAGREFWQTANLTPQQGRLFGLLGYDLPLERFEARLEDS